MSRLYIAQFFHLGSSQKFFFSIYYRALLRTPNTHTHTICTHRTIMATNGMGKMARKNRRNERTKKLHREITIRFYDDHDFFFFICNYHLSPFFLSLSLFHIHHHQIKPNASLYRNFIWVSISFGFERVGIYRYQQQYQNRLTHII